MPKFPEISECLFLLSVSNSSSEITGNLYIESNSVDKLIVNGANNDEPELLIARMILSVRILLTNQVKMRN